MLSSILTTGTDGAITLTSFLTCAAMSIILGIITSCAYMYKNHYTKGFAVTLALLPLMVQTVITLVNGNLGVGVAVAGAFSLIRFRSAQGGGRELGAIFMTMAIGLATGMGYVGIAAIVTIMVCALQVILTSSKFGCGNRQEKQLKITIPENLDYDGVFDEIFDAYTISHEMTKIKTASMGTVYELTYVIRMKDANDSKKMMDDIRIRNGNLPVVIGKLETSKEEL